MLFVAVNMGKTGRLSFSLRLAVWHSGEGDALRARLRRKGWVLGRGDSGFSSQSPGGRKGPFLQGR